MALDWQVLLAFAILAVIAIGVVWSLIQSKPSPFDRPSSKRPMSGSYFTGMGKQSSTNYRHLVTQYPNKIRQDVDYENYPRNPLPNTTDPLLTALIVSELSENPGSSEPSCSNDGNDTGQSDACGGGED